MDFDCPVCDAGAHFCGEFAYAIRCPDCGAVFKMPTDLPLERVGDPEDVVSVLDAEDT